MAGSRHSNFRISAAPVLLALCVALYAVGLLRPVSAACGAGDACSGHGTCTQSPAYAQTTKHCECDAGYIVQDCSVATGRATRGLSTLYTMHEAGGCTVHDVSGRGAPHDLRYFADEESLEWGPGLISSDHVPNPTRVFSFEPPIKVRPYCSLPFGCCLFPIPFLGRVFPCVLVKIRRWNLGCTHSLVQTNRLTGGGGGDCVGRFHD